MDEVSWCIDCDESLCDELWCNMMWWVVVMIYDDMWCYMMIYDVIYDALMLGGGYEYERGAEPL